MPKKKWKHPLLGRFDEEGSLYVAADGSDWTPGCVERRGNLEDLMKWGVIPDVGESHYTSSKSWDRVFDVDGVACLTDRTVTPKSRPRYRYW